MLDVGILFMSLKKRIVSGITNIAFNITELNENSRKLANQNFWGVEGGLRYMHELLVKQKKDNTFRRG